MYTKRTLKHPSDRHKFASSSLVGKDFESA